MVSTPSLDNFTLRLLVERRPSATGLLLERLAQPSQHPAHHGKTAAGAVGATPTLVLLAVAIHADLRGIPTLPSFPADVATLTGLSASTCGEHLRTWERSRWLQKVREGRRSAFRLAPHLLTEMPR